MRNQKLFYILPLFLTATILFFSNFSNTEFENKLGASSEAMARSEENFGKMMAVLTHKRCMNCHPSDHTPKQGEDSHPHFFGVKRGAANLGFPATKCNTCHQDENNEFSGVPGAPKWSLAPKTMNWEGLSRTEIATSILDKKRNGGKNHHEILEHLTQDPLVLWAWNPGIDTEGTPRETPPVPVDEYITAVKEWFEAGAIIPNE